MDTNGTNASFTCLKCYDTKKDGNCWTLSNQTNHCESSSEWGCYTAKLNGKLEKKN